MKAGRGRSSASPTSSASGTPSRRRRGSTNPIQSRPGDCTSRSSTGGRRRSRSVASTLIRFRGPGTDLTVGLTDRTLWCTAKEVTVDGREHVVNMPTEEVFTSPDRRRTEGVVRSTTPLALAGTIVRDLEIRFEGGRAVEVNASVGRRGRPRADALRRRRLDARRGRARGRRRRGSARPASSS